MAFRHKLHEMHCIVYTVVNVYCRDVPFISAVAGVPSVTNNPAVAVRSVLLLYTAVGLLCFYTPAVASATAAFSCL
jgi:hypothetical protein